MPVSLKYAVVERERRFLLASLPEGTAEVACTNFYLDQQEWDVLSKLPGRVLRKTRYVVRRGGFTVAVKEPSCKQASGREDR